MHANKNGIMMGFSRMKGKSYSSDTSSSSFTVIQQIPTAGGRRKRRRRRKGGFDVRMLEVTEERRTVIWRLSSVKYLCCVSASS